MNDRFIVFTVDPDQQQFFTDFVTAANHESALEEVLGRRDYCVHGGALTAEELRWLADECEAV
ncbi:MAG: hypothetical protein R3C10_28160 [Pirellulales bacterium]